MKILHITSHLGGGVGKVLSGLISQYINIKTDIKHSIVCLEEPIDKQFLNEIINNNTNVILSPSYEELELLMKEFDIVQLEFWNHPLMMKYLCCMNIPPIRLIIWYHNSGLHTPLIDKNLILNSHKFIFTSKCSLENKEYSQLIPESEDIIDIIPSSGGFSGFTLTDARKLNNDISVGYLGSINFSKMHPDYVEYMSKVDIPNFKIKIIGRKIYNAHTLNKQCDNIGKPGMLEFAGFVPNVKAELNSINVLAYILNPYHYGSGENALLESMYMGIVPIVLNNSAEKCIVMDKVTGLIVKSPEEFGKAIRWLSENPLERLRIGTRAAIYISANFNALLTNSLLAKNYEKVMKMKKKSISFTDIFGNTPSEWFLYFQKDKNIFKNDGTVTISNDSMKNYILFEDSKGSVFHFVKYFPYDVELNTWAKNLKLLQ